MANPMTLDDHRARADELDQEIRKTEVEYAGQKFPDDVKEHWNELNEELEDVRTTIVELEQREQRIDELVSRGSDRNTESGADPGPQKVNRKRNHNRVPDDPTRIEAYRSMSNTFEELQDAYTDGAKRILERNYKPAHLDADLEGSQGKIERLLNTGDHATAEDGPRSLARRIIQTSSRAYGKEFETYMKTQGRVVGPEMERAASLTTTAGGFAVPVELDTTLILVSAGVINPIRQLARVRTTVVNTVEFLSTTGITAAYGNEATEASDGAPTLAQPTVNIEKAQAFVPGSIEVFEDWANIQADLAMAFQDAKDTLENTKFLTGLGHASHEPQGLIAAGGATAIVTSASTATFALADVYSLTQALNPRWRARATIVGNRATFDKARQFNTAGTYGAWVDMADGRPSTLTGYPIREWSAYSSAVTTSASTVLTVGDFNQFAIVDRVGMSVEFIPHLFGGSNRFPTGQRALYCYWRNSSQVLTPSLLANSAFVSLKLL